MYSKIVRKKHIGEHDILLRRMTASLSEEALDKCPTDINEQTKYMQISQIALHCRVTYEGKN